MILNKRMNGIRLNEKVREAIKDYYEEKGTPQPAWRMPDPEWWVNYLRELELEP